MDGKKENDEHFAHRIFRIQIFESFSTLKPSPYHNSLYPKLSPTQTPRSSSHNSHGNSPRSDKDPTGT